MANLRFFKSRTEQQALSETKPVQKLYKFSTYFSDVSFGVTTKTLEINTDYALGNGSNGIFNGVDLTNVSGKTCVDDAWIVCIKKKIQGGSEYAYLVAKSSQSPDNKDTIESAYAEGNPYVLASLGSDATSISTAPRFNSVDVGDANVMKGVKQDPAATNVQADENSLCVANDTGAIIFGGRKVGGDDLKVATKDKLGGVKSSDYTGQNINTERLYNVKVQDDGTMKVYVPWHDTLQLDIENAEVLDSMTWNAADPDNYCAYIDEDDPLRCRGGFVSENNIEAAGDVIANKGKTNEVSLTDLAQKVGGKLENPTTGNNASVNDEGVFVVASNKIYGSESAAISDTIAKIDARNADNSVVFLNYVTREFLYKGILTDAPDEDGVWMMLISNGLVSFAKVGDAVTEFAPPSDDTETEETTSETA